MGAFWVFYLWTLLKVFRKIWDSSSAVVVYIMYWEICLTVNSTWDREGLFLLLVVLFIVKLKNSAQRIVNWQWLQTLIKKDVFSLSRSKDFFFKPVINNRKKLTWKVFWIIILMYLLAVGMVCYIHSSWVWNLTFAVLWLSLTRLLYHPCLSSSPFGTLQAFHKFDCGMLFCKPVSVYS